MVSVYVTVNPYNTNDKKIMLQIMLYKNIKSIYFSV